MSAVGYDFHVGEFFECGDEAASVRPAAQRPTSAGASSWRPSVLIVDDEDINLTVLQAMLVGFEVDVVKADSGELALELARRHEFALVLMDVQMPGIRDSIIWLRLVAWACSIAFLRAACQVCHVGGPNDSRPAHRSKARFQWLWPSVSPNSATAESDDNRKK